MLIKHSRVQYLQPCMAKLFLNEIYHEYHETPEMIDLPERLKVRGNAYILVETNSLYEKSPTVMV